MSNDSHNDQNGQTLPLFGDFLNWEAGSKDTIDFKKIYVDMTGGDLLAGLMLSQIVYWYLPNSKGASKLRVFKHGHYWIAKRLEDWKKEIRMTKDQAKRALKVLADKKLIVKENYLFNGLRTNHIRINQQEFMQSWSENLPKSAPQDDDQGNENDPKGDNPPPVRHKTPTGQGLNSDRSGIKPPPITENTSQTTEKNTSSSCDQKQPEESANGKQPNDDDEILSDIHSGLVVLGLKDKASRSRLIADCEIKEPGKLKKLVGHWLEWEAAGGQKPDNWHGSPQSYIYTKIVNGEEPPQVKGKVVAKYGGVPMNIFDQQIEYWQGIDGDDLPPGTVEVQPEPESNGQMAVDQEWFNKAMTAAKAKLPEPEYPAYYNPEDNSYNL